MFTLLPTQLEQAERYISKDDLLLLAQGWFDVASPDGITTDDGEITAWTNKGLAANPFGTLTAADGTRPVALEGGVGFGAGAYMSSVAPAFTGTIVMATNEGAFAASITLDAGSANLSGFGFGDYFDASVKAVYGIALIGRALTQGEIASILTIFEGDNDFTVATDLTEAWKDVSSLTAISKYLFGRSPCTVYTNAFTGCSLTQDAINDILISIDDAGTSNGTLDIDGGTNQAPSDDGYDSLVTLEGRGWTINTNQIPLLTADAKGWYDTKAIVPSSPNVSSFNSASGESLSRAAIDITGIDITAPFTVAGWVRTTNRVSNNSMLTIWGGGGFRLIQIGSTGQWRFYAFDDNGAMNVVLPPVNASDGDWVHIAAGFNGTQLFMVIDGGVRSVYAASSVKPSSSPLVIGRQGTSHDGQISNVGFWGRVLTTQEILALYRGGTVGPIPDSVKTGGVSFWPLDEESDGTSAVERRDAWGSNNLTDSGTVASVVGPVGYMGTPNRVAEDAAVVAADLVASFDRANAELLSFYTPLGHELHPSGEFTFSTWVKGAAGGVGSNQNIIENFASNLGGYRLLALGDGRLFWELDPQTYEINGSLDGNWQFLTLGWDGSNMVTSINGVVTTFARTTTVQGPAREFRLGRSSDFDIGPTAAWNRALTSAEITALYNSGTPRYYPDLTTAEKVDIVSFWNLDEESGSRADSHGSNTLTDNNTVGTALGKVAAVTADAISLKTDLVASFDSANSEYLSVRHDAQSGLDLSQYSAFTISAWVKFAADGVDRAIYTRWGGGLQLLFVKRYDNLFSTRINNASDASIHSLGAAATGGWQHVVGVWDGAQLTTYVDDTAGSPVALTSIKSGVAASHEYQVGAWSGVNYSANGEMAHATVWNRALSAGEITALYNAGTPRPYADLTTSEKVDLVSFWNLNEPRGTRYDSHGSNHLTDNNTVGAATGPVEVEASQYAGITKWENQGLAASPFGDVAINAPGDAPQFIGGVLVYDVLSNALRTTSGETLGDSTIVFVGSKDAAAPSDAYVMDSNDASFRRILYVPSGKYRAYSNAVFSTASNVSTDRVLVFASFTSTDVTLQVDADVFTTSIGTTEGMKGLSVGGINSLHSFYNWVGTIDSVLVFDHALTNVEKAALTSYFS